MRRREFIILMGGAAVWPVEARAQQPAMPVVALVTGRSADGSAAVAAAFRKGLNETGYAEGQNVTVEYHWLAGQYDRVPAVMVDLVRRRVAVIVTPSIATVALAAEAATATILIVFGIGEDPVQRGLVGSLARPGGNATGTNFFATEVAAKRLRLLHDLVPNAVRIAVLVNPASAWNTEIDLAKEILQITHADIGNGPVENKDILLTVADSVSVRRLRYLFMVAAMRKGQIIPLPPIISRPSCEICDAQMWLVSIEPDKPDHDRRTFECPRCQHEVVVIVKYK